MGTREYKPITVGKYTCQYQGNCYYSVRCGEEYLGFIFATKADLTEELIDSRAEEMRKYVKRCDVHDMLRERQKELDAATKEMVGKMFEGHPDRDLIVEMVECKIR